MGSRPRNAARIAFPNRWVTTPKGVVLGSCGDIATEDDARGFRGGGGGRTGVTTPRNAARVTSASGSADATAGRRHRREGAPKIGGRRDAAGRRRRPFYFQLRLGILWSMGLAPLAPNAIGRSRLLGDQSAPPILAEFIPGRFGKRIGPTH